MSQRNYCSRSSPSMDNSSRWDISLKLPLHWSLMKASLKQKRLRETLTTLAFWTKKSQLVFSKTRIHWIRRRNSTCSSRMFHQPWIPLFYITSCRVSSEMLLHWYSRRKTKQSIILAMVMFNLKRRKISRKSCTSKKSRERLPSKTLNTLSMSSNSAVRDQRLK